MGGWKRAPEARVCRGVWGHPPPENFEIYSLGNRVYSILREILLEIISLDKA